jgi:hypothetical protein
LSAPDEARRIAANIAKLPKPCAPHLRIRGLMERRRFPPPWTVDELKARFGENDSANRSSRN